MPGCQVRHILGTLHLKGYAEGSSQVFQCALNGKEVLMLTKGHKAQVQALFQGSSVSGSCLGT